MEITVIIPSRNRIWGLASVIRSLNFLESGKNTVKYAVAIDDDDEDSIRTLQWLKQLAPIGYRTGPRPLTMGGIVNEMAKLEPGDVYLVINDDILCISPNWDECIAEAVKKTPHGVFWWTDASGNGALFPIVTEKWRAAAGGVFSEWFPFWYDDLCLCELWMMTTDEEIQILECKIVDKPRTVTTRMRELKFWQKVYIASRVLRQKQARQIAKELGLPDPQCTDHVAALMNNHLKRVSDEWIDQIESNQGDKTPPDPNYLISREKAQRMMEEVSRELAERETNSAARSATIALAA